MNKLLEVVQTEEARKSSGVADSLNSDLPVQSNRIPDAARVTSVTHWSDRLFSFRVERPESLRFRSGEFVMLGLMEESESGKSRPLLRAYSIASPSWEEELEFYSIKVPDGPLTSRLQHLQVGDDIVLRPRPVGTLVLDALLPGNRLWLLATGTGVAPFASLIQDPETYEKFDSVVLMHTCREKIELAYSEQLVKAVQTHEFLADIVADKFIFYPSTTRESYKNQGRITTALQSDEFFSETGLTPMSGDADRCMICGSLDFNMDVIGLLKEYGLVEGSNSEPGTYVVEKAFVD
ncbi:MAG: ferredoxin--NADP reductase [Gammaproteobacteria bacterium]|nr:ferredoxin--NADP reductase [Gammaproteobacteria bacterium]